MNGWVDGQEGRQTADWLGDGASEGRSRSVVAEGGCVWQSAAHGLFGRCMARRCTPGCVQSVCSSCVWTRKRLRDNILVSSKRCHSHSEYAIPPSLPFPPSFPPWLAGWLAAWRAVRWCPSRPADVCCRGCRDAQRLRPDRAVISAGGGCRASTDPSVLLRRLKRHPSVEALQPPHADRPLDPPPRSSAASLTAAEQPMVCQCCQPGRTAPVILRLFPPTSLPPSVPAPPSGARPQRLHAALLLPLPLGAHC